MSNNGTMNIGRYWDFVTKYTQIFISLSYKPFICLLITLSSSLFSHLYLTTKLAITYTLITSEALHENYKNKTLKTRKLKIYTNKNMYACSAHTYTRM